MLPFIWIATWSSSNRLIFELTTMNIVSVACKRKTAKTIQHTEKETLSYTWANRLSCCLKEVTSAIFPRLWHFPLEFNSIIEFSCIFVWVAFEIRLQSKRVFVGVWCWSEFDILLLSYWLRVFQLIESPLFFLPIKMLRNQFNFDELGCWRFFWGEIECITSSKWFSSSFHQFERTHLLLTYLLMSKICTKRA